jgi:hypothetical protein
MCILEEGKLCDNCCECFVCDLDPGKTCDNCAKCIELADFNAISIDDILLREELIIRFGKNGKYGSHKKMAGIKAFYLGVLCAFCHN